MLGEPYIFYSYDNFKKILFCTFGLPIPMIEDIWDLETISVQRGIILSSVENQKTEGICGRVNKTWLIV